MLSTHLRDASHAMFIRRGIRDSNVDCRTPSAPYISCRLLRDLLGIRAIAAVGVVHGNALITGIKLVKLSYDK